MDGSGRRLEFLRATGKKVLWWISRSASSERWDDITVISYPLMSKTNLMVSMWRRGNNPATKSWQSSQHVIRPGDHGRLQGLDDIMEPGDWINSIGISKPTGKGFTRGEPALVLRLGHRRCYETIANFIIEL